MNLWGLPSHARDPRNQAANTVTINSFTSGVDGILIDSPNVVGNMGNAQNITAAQYETGAGAPTVAAWTGVTNQFYVDTTNQNLWYSTNVAAANAVEAAHFATGVPAQADIHVF